MIPGECVNEDTCTCCGCGELLKVKVCRSAAGYYIGFTCNNCGPYSRESYYFRSREEARHALDTQPKEAWERM